MSQWKIVSRILIVLMISSVISACGFHLRGSIPLPDGIKNMHVAAELGVFKDTLEKVLTNAGANIATQSALSDVQLVIKKAVVKRTVGTLDARGKADSYKLNYQVEYDLLAPDGKVIRSSKLRENRRYNFDADSALEAETQEEELMEDMDEAIALRIVRQLSTVSNYSPAQKPVEASSN